MTHQFAFHKALSVLLAGLFAVAHASSLLAYEQNEPNTTGAASDASSDNVLPVEKSQEETSGDMPVNLTQEPAETTTETQTLMVNDNLLRFTLPATWKQVEPRNRLIEVEFAVHPQNVANAPDNGSPSPSEVPGDAQPTGRLTMMAAGGDVDSNIRRWVGQFRLGRDADGKDAMRRDRRPLRGAVAHVLDIAGTYFDSPKGPLGPKVELPDYRMLGAIIEIEGAGKYFVKFYGPVEIVDENASAFETMLKQLEVAGAEGVPITDAADSESNTNPAPSPPATTNEQVQG